MTVGAAGNRAWDQQLAAGTSPSITALDGGGYEVAVQSGGGLLTVLGATGVQDLRQGMRSATSPAITHVAGGYEVAFQANTGSLVSVGTTVRRDWRQGIRDGTSPAIAATTTGFVMAFQANTGSLVSIGPAGGVNWRQGMSAGSSPSVAGLPGGGFQLAFEANTRQLITVGSKGGSNTRQGMAPGTSSSISGFCSTGTAACTATGPLSSWSVRRLAEQTVVVPVQETSVGSVSQQVADGAGGVILFGSSAPTDLATQLRALTIRAPDGIAPLVMTDEEGGAVQRMANLVGAYPSARTAGSTMTPAQIRAEGQQLGSRLRSVGVTMDLAPVLDLDAGSGPSSTNPVGTRSYSAGPATASADGTAFALGLQAAGVVPVVKHFPGLGGADGNTDYMSASTPPWSEVQQSGLLPFATAVRSGARAMMISNAVVPGLTDRPASLSAAAITDVVRGQLAYAGLVITDSLSAGAISQAGYPVPQAAVAAVVAGADMVLFGSAPADTATVTAQVADAEVSAVQQGRLSRARLEDAVTRVLAAKGLVACG